LQIFEVRYLDMIGKCHRSGTPFGVVAMTQGQEVRQPDSAAPTGGFKTERFETVGTLATINEFSSPQAGLMVIRCTGAQRFRIQHQEQLKHGLWVADVSLLAADVPVKIPEDLLGVATALAKFVTSLKINEVPTEQMPIQPPYRLDDCGWVANRWCELLPIAQADKQRLMALDNPLLRLELVSDQLAQFGIAA
jgi:Lon protease-like protein